MTKTEMRELINHLSETVIDAYDIEIPIVDIRPFIIQLGGKVTEDSNLSNYADGFIRKDGNSFEISISPYQSEGRRNFTLAHELGHLFLHMGYQIPELWNEQPDTCFYRNGSSMEEYQANEFAAALLMPRKEYCKVFEDNTIDETVNLTKVAQYFNVSVDAASTRGKWLGCLPW